MGAGARADRAMRTPDPAYAAEARAPAAAQARRRDPRHRRTPSSTGNAARGSRGARLVPRAGRWLDCRMTEQNPGQDAGTEQRIVVVGPDGQPIGVLDQGSVDDTEATEGGTSVADLVEQPAKVMRIGSMIKQLLEEVRGAPLDEASRARLRDIHRRSITELESGLAPELVEELERLSLPFTDDSIPTDAELRIAQAQLVGWLEGLFHGIQTALFAQQMAARAQIEQMRRRAIGGPGVPEGAGDGRGDSSGLYL